jgi:hypothetical protein
MPPLRRSRQELSAAASDSAYVMKRAPCQISESPQLLWGRSAFQSPFSAAAKQQLAGAGPAAPAGEAFADARRRVAGLGVVFFAPFARHQLAVTPTEQNGSAAAAAGTPGDHWQRLHVQIEELGE